MLADALLHEDMWKYDASEHPLLNELLKPGAYRSSGPCLAE